jgi:hypothetical protein
MWWKNYNQSNVNSEAIGVSTEKAIDAPNTLVKKMWTTFKNITKPNAFVEKEQWSIVRMKEEFHAKFVTIL